MQWFFPSYDELDGNHVFSGSGPWPCFLTIHVLCCIRYVSHGLFSYLHASCIGQAKNPGPSKHSIRVAVTNPTAVYGKLPELRDFEADAIFASETSATSVVQRHCTREMILHQYKSFWSVPVASKKATLDSRPSYRGEAVGSAIFSRLPCRQTRASINDNLWNTQRFSSCILRLGSFEVLAISVYGFANRHKEGIRPNDLLIANLIPVIEEVGLPYLVAGDFNEPLVKLPAYKYFQDRGAVEAFQWYRSRHGHDLPTTCAGSTRNDTAFMHPAIADHICDMSVQSKHKIDIHTPLFIDFSISSLSEEKRVWNIPNSWAHFAPSADLIAQSYQSMTFEFGMNQEPCDVGQIEHAFASWSHHVEKAVDCAIRKQHALDPVRYPMKSLPKSCKGRCSQKKFKSCERRHTVKNDRHGGFTPTSEVFLLETKLKVRQTRRIKSLIRRLKALPAFPDSLNVQQCTSLEDAKREWTKILSAKGYGNSWRSWILGFEAVEYLPLDLPDMDILNLVEQITEHDCVHACFSETKFRADRFKAMMEIDQTEDFCKTTYKILRAKRTETLSEVPVVWEVEASLLRSKPGATLLKLDSYRFIPSFARLKFGGIDVELVQQDGCKIFFKSTGGAIPSRGMLQVMYTAVTAAEIGHEFSNFWSKMWLRDGQHEQFSADTWNHFDELLQGIDLPVVSEIEIPWDNMTLWMHLVRSLPAGKAVGPCGWSNDELKLLPECCIRDLVKIYSKVCTTGFGPGMMAAKTILLSKIPVPLSMHHARPITILSSLYRLFGKFIFRVVAGAWKDIFPYDISGGLPGRGVKELAFTQKRVIEDALINSTDIGGYSLDLIRAYNTFGRYAIGRMMCRLGVPSVLVQSWIRSLDCMVRYPTIQGCVTSGICSTTGVPEGCSISVLAMLAVSCTFHSHLQSESVRPFAYADNWSWMVNHQREHYAAYQKTIRMANVMRLEIDHSKSWHWATKKAHRDLCKTFDIPGSDSFPDVKTCVKDLGEMVSYNKSVSLGFIKDKIDEAVSRLQRLEWITAELPVKAKMIQSAVWPLALYSSDTTYIGQHHFNSLRKAAARALVGKWHNTSSVICCTLISKFVMDPFLHTLLQCLRVLRRLATIMPTLAKETIVCAVDWDGSKPFGPATALKQYIRQTGWSLSLDGCLKGPDYLECNILLDSCRHITKTVRLMWNHHVLTLVDRKGVGDFLPDVKLFHSVFSSLEVKEQSILKLNVAGAFQTQAQKAKWDPDCSENCLLCDDKDTREHRVLECTELQSIRSLHTEACETLSAVRPEWVYLPIPRQCDHLPLLRAYLMLIKEPEVAAPKCQAQCLHFFTDGGTKHPKSPNARIATWAVVEDISESGVQQKEVLDYLYLDQPKFPLFHVSELGVVPGEQTVARAELFALVIAVEKVHKRSPLPEAEFITDASYVCSVVRLIQLGLASSILHKLTNCDLVARLALTWHSQKFRLIKVKSHRKFESAVDHIDLWRIAGNFCADIAVNAACAVIPQHIHDLVSQIIQHESNEKQLLRDYFSYMAELNRKRCQLLDALNVKPASHLLHPRQEERRDISIFDSHAMGIEALECLIKFDPPGYSQRPPIPAEDEKFHLCLQGANIAKAFKIFCESLRWPDDITEDYDAKGKGDWGISWFELLTSFYLTTGWRCPIKTGGAGAKAIYLDYGHPDALLLPDAKRGVALQILCMRNLLQNVSTILGDDLLPKFSSSKSYSMTHLGLKTPVAGMPCRPVIPKQKETMMFVWDYFLKLNGALALCKPLYCSNVVPIFHFERLVEKTALERWQLNQKHMKILRAARNAGA